MDTFKDILSTIDNGIVENNPKNNGIEKLEKVRDYILENNLDKIHYMPYHRSYKY